MSPRHVVCRMSQRFFHSINRAFSSLIPCITGRTSIHLPTSVHARFADLALECTSQPAHFTMIMLCTCSLHDFIHPLHRPCPPATINLCLKQLIKLLTDQRYAYYTRSVKRLYVHQRSTFFFRTTSITTTTTKNATLYLDVAKNHCGFLLADFLVRSLSLACYSAHALPIVQESYN